MHKRAAGVYRPGSPMRRMREVVMNAVATLLIAVVRIALVTALLLHALINAFGDTETVDLQ